MMRRFLATFVLTTSEQRLVVLIVLGLVIAAWVQHARENNLAETSTSTTEALPSPFASPTPNDH